MRQIPDGKGRMQCPYCSIHNLRGTVGLKAHIRISHQEKMEIPSPKNRLLTFGQIVAKAEEYERKARDLRKAAEALALENFIE